MNDSIQHEWYTALRDLTDGYTSDQLAIMLVEAGLAKEGQSLDVVAAHVRACLNPNRRDFFKVSELVALMRCIGRLHPLAFMCQHVGCNSPSFKDETLSSGLTVVELERVRKELVRETGLVEVRLSELRSLQHRSNTPRRYREVLFSQEQDAAGS